MFIKAMWLDQESKMYEGHFHIEQLEINPFVKSSRLHQWINR